MHLVFKMITSNDCVQSRTQLMRRGFWKSDTRAPPRVPMSAIHLKGHGHMFVFKVMPTVTGRRVTHGISYCREQIARRVTPWCPEKSRSSPSPTLVSKLRGRSRGHWAPLPRSRPGIRPSPQLPQPRGPDVAPPAGSDAGGPANGGVCGAVRETSRRQRAPP